MIHLHHADSIMMSLLKKHLCAININHTNIPVFVLHNIDHRTIYLCVSHYRIGRWSAIGCSKGPRSFLHFSLARQGRTCFCVRSWYTLYSSVVGFIQKGGGCMASVRKKEPKMRDYRFATSISFLFFIPSLQQPWLMITRFVRKKMPLTGLPANWFTIKHPISLQLTHPPLLALSLALPVVRL